MTDPSAIARWLVPGLVLSACWYRDRPAAPGPGAQAPLEAQACSPLDDTRHPPLDPGEGGRMRTHVQGSLSANARRHGGKRTWSGDEVPAFIPRALGTLELFLLDPADAGYLALYREPYELHSCQLGGAENCAYEVRHFDTAGQVKWQLRLNDLMSRHDHLEIQDIRLAGGVLYFNEACQSYASGADGQCSSLVAADPIARRVLWRSPPLVSNSRFVVRGCYLVTGYGFTSEPDFVFLVSRATGKVLQRIPIASAPQKMTLVGRDLLDVQIYSGAIGRFRLVDFDGPAGALKLLDEDPAFGGAAYAGAAYGGAAYGGASYGQNRPRFRRPPPRPRRP
jgi:hypothetical protein